MRLGLLVRARLFNCLCYVGQPSGTSQACAAPMPRARWQAGDLQSMCALRHSAPARVRTVKTWYLANLCTLYRTRKHQTPGAPGASQLWSPEYRIHASGLRPHVPAACSGRRVPWPLGRPLRQTIQIKKSATMRAACADVPRCRPAAE